MAKTSTSENKNIYYQLRHAQNWSRERARQELECIPPERIERIENGKFAANPDEVVIIDGQEQTKVPTNTKKTPEPQPEKQTTEELTTEELTTEELPPAEPNTETPTQEESTTQEENPTPNEQGE